MEDELIREELFTEEQSGVKEFKKQLDKLFIKGRAQEEYYSKEQEYVISFKDYYNLNYNND